MTKKTVFVLSLFLVLNILNLNAQEVFKLVPETSTMKITGTSSLHDWEMKVTRFMCNVTLEKKKESVIVRSVLLTVESSGILSESSLMDRKAHDALKAKKYPEIKFTLTQSEDALAVNGRFASDMDGELAMSGVSKKIDVAVNVEFQGDNRLLVSGAKTFDMTEMGIEPPTAMLGALKTGKSITITFSLNFIRQQE